MATQYRDIDLRLIKHPFTDDITTLDDEMAIITSIKNLILLNKGERHFNSRLGSGITSLVFEHFDSIVLDALEQNVTSMISNFEPRVEKIRLRSFEETDNSIVIKIFYTRRNVSEEKTFDFIIQKNR